MRPTATAALSAATSPAYSTWPARISLPLGVYPPSQVLQIAGAFLRAPLPSVLMKALRAAGPLRSAGITPPRRYSGPIRHPLVVSRLPGVAGYTAYPASAVSGRYEEGFSSCWVCPCRRAVANHPAGGRQRVNRFALPPATFALTVAGSAPGSIPFEATSRSLALRPGDSLPSQGWGCQWASGQSVSLLPAIQLRGFPILTPAGLTPAGHISLFWTHNCSGTFRCKQLKHRTTSLRDTTRFGSAGRRHPFRDAVPPWRGDNLSVTAAEPAPDRTSVVAVAPAKIITISPTYLHHCLTPVG